MLRTQLSSFLRTATYISFWQSSLTGNFLLYAYSNLHSILAENVSCTQTFPAQSAHNSLTTRLAATLETVNFYYTIILYCIVLLYLIYCIFVMKKALRGNANTARWL